MYEDKNSDALFDELVDMGRRQRQETPEQTADHYEKIARRMGFPEDEVQSLRLMMLNRVN